jgi:hypothetical protein
LIGENPDTGKICAQAPATIDNTGYGGRRVRRGPLRP